MMTQRLPHILAICAMMFIGCTEKESTSNTTSDTGSETSTDTTSEGAADVAADVAPDNIDTAPSVPPLQIQYLKGSSDTTSPDGTIPYEVNVEVVIKRTIDHANDTITEESWHGAEHRMSFLTLREGTLIFDVTDEEKTFEGTMTFETKDWVYGSIVYDINMLDGSGTLTGTGVWEGQTYKTDKLFSDPSGTPQAKIAEALDVITEEDFLASVPN